jgi:hypothetical protein
LYFVAVSHFIVKRFSSAFRCAASADFPPLVAEIGTEGSLQNYKQMVDAAKARQEV